MEQDYIKLIFGLKLKQVRTERGTFTIWSFKIIRACPNPILNEIEKGKKYPKPDKIVLALSEHLDIAIR
jgi:hypothetical protein